jgi:hypothetical protein
MIHNKVLFITSIYGKLWGTEFGGRPSRERHYRESLINILNMKPSHCVCFTSKDEYDELCDYFYNKKNISKELLDVRIFNLEDSKYFNEIKIKKDLEKMKKTDRCFEIQYNKFFWFESINNVNEYDRVYWIDAGLSHGGLFPIQYRINDTFNEYYNITLFTPDLIQRINNKTESKLFLLAKNNTGKFFWSQTIPNKYYNEYNRNKHIVGGMFGGTPKMYKKILNMFDELLHNLLINENDLYLEEQIMSCLYVNNIENFITDDFDDWYQRKKEDIGIKYFYNIFE